MNTSAFIIKGDGFSSLSFLLFSAYTQVALNCSLEKWIKFRFCWAMPMVCCSIRFMMILPTFAIFSLKVEVSTMCLFCTSGNNS